MKVSLGAAAIIVVVSAMTVGALVGDQLEQRLGGAGTELQNAVAVAGRVQIAITTLTENDVLKNREEILHRLVDLREQVDRIGVAFSSFDTRPFDVKLLDDSERVVFLNFLSSATNKVVMGQSNIDVETIRAGYSILQKNLSLYISNYEVLLKEFRPSLNPFAQRRLGSARADLTISLGQLVQFSGFVQKMAYAPA
jgi:hypothetical protein